ncbi:hypothetical protein DFJ58DRAFT_683701 [Suillus subalutaceus]|uniref:uncharacterized protein n=1 Tax=Suillus subalutaceus TaxID=48586 RepID=UPI001B883458|nr:uncharacterized protein DFJ58DRAFT_683701 [Suillus subalutaceus]KAG1855174.1 hypothetical protein DFJ58DRAFT_683701 [Suillus subalutaceus]
MVPTSSHSSGFKRGSLNGLYHRHYGTRPRQRRHLQTARDEADAIKSYEPQYHKGKGYTASPKDKERGKKQEQSPSSVYMQQGALESLNQFSDIFDPTGPNHSKALTEGTTVNPLHQQQPVGTQVSLAKLHPSLPNCPVFVELPPRISSTTIASSLPEKPQSTPDSNVTSRLTRNLWDTRREMTALRARETDLVASLCHLDAPRHILESGRAQKSSELEARLAEVENELRQERYKRLRAERGLNEIEAEKRAPFVVPALFQAFLMVSEIHG